MRELAKSTLSNVDFTIYTNVMLKYKRNMIKEFRSRKEAR